MTRFLLSIAFFATLAIAVGFLLSGKDPFDWAIALGLFAVALACESLRLWLRRGRARKRQSSGI